MAWRFTVIDGADQGRAFPLVEKGAMIIGNRRKEVTVFLHDLLVSPLHCRVDVDGDQIAVTELEKAKNQGTFVNGHKVTQAALHAGDVLRLGNTYLRLEPANEESAEPESAEEQSGPAPLLPVDRLEELTGYTLSHYHLGPLLGKGQVGAVFRAHDQKADHPVALKVLAPEFPAGDEEMQRFVGALKPTLPLRHPNLVTIQGVGRSGHYCWIARDFVEGESLSQVLIRLDGNRKIDWRRACRVLVHVARALEYAREHHVTHNNITPQNLLIQSADGVIKLTDLMLVKALECSQLQQAMLEKKLLAELAYLAPEQVIPDAFVDDLVDLYGLGTVVYQLLTGHPAFPGSGPEEIIEQIQIGDVTKPSQYNRNVPPAFEKVVMRMLAKHQEDRYPRFTDLREEAEHVAEAFQVQL